MICNFITLLNIFCGTAAISLAINNQYVFAAILILAAAFLDMVDGKVARILKTTSSLGDNLDSLADLVSFGVAPLVLIFTLNPQIPQIALIPLTVYLLCGVWRLARFNASPKNHLKTFSFQGLPITVAGGSIASTVWAFQKINRGSNSFILLILAMILAILMISKIKYPPFKPEQILKPKYAVMVGMILFASVIAPVMVIWMLFTAYILFSPLLNLKTNR